MGWVFVNVIRGGGRSGNLVVLELLTAWGKKEEWALFFDLAGLSLRFNFYEWNREVNGNCGDLFIIQYKFNFVFLISLVDDVNNVRKLVMWEYARGWDVYVYRLLWWRTWGSWMLWWMMTRKLYCGKLSWIRKLRGIFKYWDSLLRVMEDCWCQI